MYVLMQDGQTPLMLASGGLWPNAVRTLLMYGADATLSSVRQQLS